MTRNQLEYWNQVLTNSAKQRELDETKRHNAATEGLGRSQLAETVRSNFAKEQETNRSNLAREAEQQRTNKANEAIGTERNRISLLTTQEQARHNAAVEAEQHRANKASELLTSQRNAEQARSNRANESIGQANVGLGYGNLAESQRSHYQGEVLASKNAEIANKQANTAQWSVNSRHIQETRKAAETERHNRTMETIEAAKVGNQASQIGVQAMGNVLTTLGQLSRGLLGGAIK